MITELRMVRGIHGTGLLSLGGVSRVDTGCTLIGRSKERLFVTQFKRYTAADATPVT